MGLIPQTIEYHLIFLFQSTKAVGEIDEVRERDGESETHCHIMLTDLTLLLLFRTKYYSLCSVR